MRPTKAKVQQIDTMLQGSFQGCHCDQPTRRDESFRQLVYDLFEMQRLESFWEIVCFTRLQLKPSNMWQNTTKHNMKHENIHDKST